MPRWVPKFTKHPSFTSSRCVLGGRAKKETSGQSSWHKTSNQNRTGHFPPPNQTSNKNKKQNNTWQDAWPKYNALVIILPISVCLCVSVHDDENKQGTKQARALPSHVVELVWTDVALPRSLSSLSLPHFSLSHTRFPHHAIRFNVYSAVWLLENQLQVELSFKTGEVILVYGDMDEDGFYMGEVDGVRGLVPSNFLTESPATNSTAGGVGGGSANNRNGRMGGAGGGAVGSGMNATGPGARGPPPPNRDGMSGGMGGPNQRAQPGIRKGMWPVERRRCVNQSPPNTQFSFRI